VLDKVLREISLFIWKAPYLNIPLRKEEGSFCLLGERERERNYAYWIKHPSQGDARINVGWFLKF
jgi:hypothetical protein